MANQWFKFYGGEYLSDPKIERLSPLERSCWITLLCLASMNGNGKIEFLTVETLLNKSGIQFDPYHPEEWERALSVLVKFQNMNMIETEKNGDVMIVNWEKRQEHNLTVAERVAKSRAKRKTVTTNVTSVTTEENRIEENREDIVAKATVFDFKEKLELMKKSTKDPRMKVIAFYWFFKGLHFDNEKQYSASLRRELRPSGNLVGYDIKQVASVMEYCAKEYQVWTLETVFKRIGDLINKK